MVGAGARGVSVPVCDAMHRRRQTSPVVHNGSEGRGLDAAAAGGGAGGGGSVPAVPLDAEVPGFICSFFCAIRASKEEKDALWCVLVCSRVFLFGFAMFCVCSTLYL